MRLTTTIYRSAGLVRNDLQREAYTFCVGDGKLWLTDYSLQQRPTARHKWRSAASHSYSAFQRSTMPRSAVVVQESVIAEALANIREQFESRLKWSPE